jgi:hypothetical protein
MPKIDNDPTKHAASPFLVIAGKRSGGTYLTHCLSNHPQVFCDRGEAMHHLSVWRRALSVENVLLTLTHQEGYQASGFRMVYVQAFNPRVIKVISEIGPRVIWLTRDNKLRQGASMALNRAIRAQRAEYHPVHTFNDVKPPLQTVAPEIILKNCRMAVQEDAKAARMLVNLRVDYINVKYADLVGGEGLTNRCIPEEVGLRLCEFLGVYNFPLHCDLKRVYPVPLRAMFANWKEIYTAVKDSEFALYLEDEAHWTKEGEKWLRT